jgi:hypothetical protein
MADFMKKGSVTVDVNQMVRISKGNPGAAMALVEIAKTSPAYIDYIDRIGLRGSDVYVLFSDICDKNVTEMIAILRAVDQGRLSEDIFFDACGRQDYSGKELIKANIKS